MRGNRVKLVTASPGEVLRLLRPDLPADAMPVGPPAVRNGRIVFLVKSAEFPVAEEGKPYPESGKALCP